MPDSLAANIAQTVIAVVGNPNTGKSTLFNNLTGLRQKTANYPGRYSRATYRDIAFAHRGSGTG